MIELKDVLSILPRYDNNNACGKKGDIKKNHRFRFHGIIYDSRGLTNDIIKNSIVVGIYPYAQTYGYHTTTGILFECLDRRFDTNA